MPTDDEPLTNHDLKLLEDFHAETIADFDALIAKWRERLEGLNPNEAESLKDALEKVEALRLLHMVDFGVTSE